MKTIGLIGGITPESTKMYYDVLNQLTAVHLGKPHSAKVLINSVDFGEIKKHQQASRWDLLDNIMATAAKNLEKAGANCLLICANTMHLCIEAVKKEVTIPVFHIAEATAKQINQQKIKKVALLGTVYTMSKPFYKNVLANFNIETLVPSEADKAIINEVIYKELAVGILKETSKNNK